MMEMDRIHFTSNKLSLGLEINYFYLSLNEV